MVQDQSRAAYEPDCGWRGKVWVHSAFELASGEATFFLSNKRDSNSHIKLLEKVIQSFHDDRLFIIEDNLSAHHSRDNAVALAAWPEIQILFLPRYAC